MIEAGELAISEAQALWQPETVYLNTATYGLPPQPAWEALQAALADWHGGRGRITAALLDRLARFSAPTFYLVGNGAMITEVKRELISRGVNRKTQIRTEAFFD